MGLTMQEIAGDFVFQGKGNIAIVASRFNDAIVERLISAALDTFLRHGVKKEQLELLRVPGAFEIPLACQRISETCRFSGIVALGAVIRGSTSHFDYVAGCCANGIQQVQLKTNVPITFGVLTTDTIEQAIERSGTKAGNKGADCAMALLEMMNLLGKIEDPRKNA